MRLYHGTAAENEGRILREGLSRPGWCIYLSPSRAIAMRYGEVVFEVLGVDLQMCSSLNNDEVMYWGAISPDMIRRVV